MNNINDKYQADDQFIRLIMTHQHTLFAFIMSQIHNSNDAEDVLQDSITVMWRKFDNFIPESNFEAWGIQIAKLTCYKYIRKNSNKKVAFNSELLETIENCFIEKLPEIDMRKTALLKCIDKLPENEKKYIQLHYEKKMTIKKISEVLDISVNRMYNAMTRMHLVLRRCVKRSLMMEEQQ